MRCGTAPCKHTAALIPLLLKVSVKGLTGSFVTISGEKSKDAELIAGSNLS